MTEKAKNGDNKALMTVTQALKSYDTAEVQLIKDTVARGATDQELALFLFTAKMRGLNPLTRQIHLVKRKQKVDGVDKEVAVIQTGIDGFRLIAERTKAYAPSPKPTYFEYDKGHLIRATVFGMKIVGSQAFEYSATAKFSEYAQSFGGRLGNMWAKMPETMLEKCAEAKLLRKGFPEELSGIYTDEEMAQADSVTIHSAESPGQKGKPAIQVKATQEGSEQQGINLNGDPSMEVIEAPPEDIVEGEFHSENEGEGTYDYLLVTCPEHDQPWAINKFGKSYHRMEGDTFCNFSQQVKLVMESRGVLAGFSEKEQFSAWCKENFNGETWSKLTEKQQIEALGLVDKIIADKEASAQKNPVVEEAKKLGGVVTKKDIKKEKK